MIDWALTTYTDRGIRVVLGAAPDDMCAYAAAVRAAYAHIGTLRAFTSRCELHVERRLVAVLGGIEPTGSGRTAARQLIAHLDHAVDPYAY